MKKKHTQLKVMMECACHFVLVRTLPSARRSSE
jgi:hypothetical protein